MELATIKDLYDKIKTGEIEESKLTIILDNNCTNFYIEDDKVEVQETNGWVDIEPLYKLLFPKAQVDWC